MLQSPPAQDNALSETESDTQNGTVKNPHPLLVCHRAGGSHPPLFFVHGVAGNIARFNNLVRHLGSDEGIYVLEDLDLHSDQPILTSVEDMASLYIKEIQSVQPKGPYFVIGYSFGGLVSFEIAQRLHSQGHKVPLVALIDCGQPIFRKDYANVLFSPKILKTYLLRLKELLSDPASRATVWSRVQNELWRMFFLKLLRRKVTGSSPNPGSQPLPRTPAMLQAAKIEAAVNYKPKPFPGRLSVFRVEERIMVDKFDRYLGWGGLGEQGVDVYDVPGDHVTVAEEPYVGVLAEKLRQAVQMARDERV